MVCGQGPAPEPPRFSWIAVGTAIADRPPHRSVLEHLTHTAPPLGVTIRCQRRRHLSCLARRDQNCVTRHRVQRNSDSTRASLWWFPFLARLRYGGRRFVRLGRRYYETISHPIHVHTSIALAVLWPPWQGVIATCPQGRMGLPGSRVWNFPRMHRFFDSARSELRLAGSDVIDVAFPLS